MNERIIPLNSTIVSWEVEVLTKVEAVSDACRLR